jgi:hypothetical protein
MIGLLGKGKMGMRGTVLVAAGSLMTVFGLAGCSSGAHPAAGGASTSSGATTIPAATTSLGEAPGTTVPATTAPAATVPATTAPATTAASATSAPTTTAAASTTTASTAPAVQNLTVTDDLRAQLVAAGASLDGLSSSDYVGLQPGVTYYAFDPATQTYWAAGGLDPSPSSMEAQVAAQDDGSYLLFSEPAGGAWTAEDDGLGGVGGTPCPAIPAAVVAVWGWSAGTCRPLGV